MNKFLASLALTLVGCQPADPYSQLHSDSAIRGPAYKDIVSSMVDLADRYPNLVQVAKYGESNQGRDLVAVKIARANAHTDMKQEERPAVLITGATHGNEYLNIEDRLPQWFAENEASAPGVKKFLDKGGVIYIVPIFNPDGYEGRGRENKVGQDLNRDFSIIPLRSAKFTQPETRDFTNYLDQDLRADGLRLKVTMDYHCCMGSLVLPWGYTKEPIRDADLSRHMVVANLMRTFIDKTYPVGSTFELLGYLSQGSSKDYYYARYGALGFTFEGKVAVENRNFARHTQWWNAILDGL